MRKKLMLGAAAIFLLLSVAITFSIGWRPFIGPRVRPLTDREFASTPERLERGRYLVEGLLGCLDCHSERDRNLPGAPPRAGMEGAGAIFPDSAIGTLYSPNITPDPETGIGNWTDDMLARAIREGIGYDGRALFPTMPYLNYRHLPDDDLAAVIVYVRSLAPVRNRLPESQIVFPLKHLTYGLPEPITDPVSEPDASTPVALGQHLVRLASCADCHTPMVRGQQIAGMEFAGGMLFPGLSGKSVAATNLTQDPTGIPYYDETGFIQMIREGRIGARSIDPIMPWSFYRNLTDADLAAMFAYIRTLKPVDHAVDNDTEPTLCALCGFVHGLGENN